MHYDELFEPIYKTFMEKKDRLSAEHPEAQKIKKAFYFAICEHVEKLSSSTHIDNDTIERGGDEYILHQEEMRGYELGKAINENPELYRQHTTKTINETPELYRQHTTKTIIDKKIVKEVFLIRVGGKFRGE